VRLVASGAFDEKGVVDLFRQYDVRSFDFGHLQNPVPASLYYDARADDCWALKQTHCGTITDDTYRPRLAFPNKVWASIMPNAFDCIRPQFVDPPVALRPAYTSRLESPTVSAYVSELGSAAHLPTVIAQPEGRDPGSWPTPTAGSISENRGGRNPGDEYSPGSGDQGYLLNKDGYSMYSGGNPRPSGEGSSPERVGWGNAGGVDLGPFASVRVGSSILSASFLSGSFVAAYVGTATINKGQSTTIDGQVVFAGKNGVLIDGTVVLSARSTPSGDQLPGGQPVSTEKGGYLVDGIPVLSAGSATQGNKPFENQAEHTGSDRPNGFLGGEEQEDQSVDWSSSGGTPATQFPPKAKGSSRSGSSRAVNIQVSLVTFTALLIVALVL
jgi:hypothetical protein